MNNERDKNLKDELVSATYREHSSERTPEEIDRKILEMAATQLSRSGNVAPLFRAWTKPLALAATVVLSFAIVLEVTRLPQDVASPAVLTKPAMPASKSLREDFTPPDNSSVEKARDQARLRDGFNRDESLVAEPQTVLESASRQKAAPGDKPSESNDADIVPEPAPAANAMPASDDSSPVLAKRSPDSEIEQPEGVALGRTLESSVASFSVMEENEVIDAHRSCNALQRETAEDWLACIENLSRSGAVSEAEKEYEEYIRQFPVE